MDHNRIKEEEIIERYVFGKLTPEDQAAFEAHYFGCDECFQEVRTVEMMMHIMKQGIEKKELSLHKPQGNKRFWLFDFARIRVFSPAVAVVASALALLLLYPAWRGVVTFSELERTIEKLQKPQANVETVFLQQVRSGNVGEIQTVRLEKEIGVFVLNFNILERAVSAPKYRAEILDSSGQAIWSGENWRGTGAYEVFSIACNGSYFQAGIYTLKVYEIDPDSKQVVNEFSFIFEVGSEL
ncbi:MAG: zf-HC2 domain-containing protein [Desulfobacteraceae bacterium]|nr:zf-HC2 domain-containing protein [Desulfobacteraceae bacterium]